MYYTKNEETLQHHGILGQKWGIRRFQNKDGTRTAAGKARERGESSDEAQNGGTKKGISKETIKKAAIVGAGVAAGAILITNPATRNALAKYGKTTLSNLKDKDKAKAVGAKIGGVIGDKAANIVNKAEKQAGKAGDAMLDAALASVGGIAISKLSEKMAPKDNEPETKKNKKKVALSAATAGIRTMTNGNNSGNGNAKVDKNSKEYQKLFDGLDNDSDRKKIKDRANEGASMEELQKLRDELRHDDIQNWIDSVIYNPEKL